MARQHAYMRAFALKARDLAGDATQLTKAVKHTITTGLVKVLDEPQTETEKDERSLVLTALIGDWVSGQADTILRRYKPKSDTGKAQRDLLDRPYVLGDKTVRFADMRPPEVREHVLPRIETQERNAVEARKQITAVLNLCKRDDLTIGEQI